MSYDLIIISQSSPELIPITQQCIDTARLDDCELNIIVVETGQRYEYNVNKIVMYEGVFNYNRALNLGLRYAKNEVHILANNDIIFHKGWSKIGELMKLNNYHSASAWAWHLTMFELGDTIYPGYKVGYILTGWCLFMDRFCHETIGELDESVPFWYSDNIYACQLEAAGIRHGLFANVQIDHIASKTLLKQPSRMQRYYQGGAIQIFNQRKRYYAERKRLQ